VFCVNMNLWKCVHFCELCYMHYLFLPLLRFQVLRRFRGRYCLHQGDEWWWGSTHLWNVGQLREYTAQYPRRLSYSTHNIRFELHRLSWNWFHGKFT
jgi:hypothetical protein